MEEPKQMKTEPIEFQTTGSLQSLEPDELSLQIKSEPMECQSTVSLQSSENIGVSTAQNSEDTECQMDSQQPFPVMLHIAGSVELLLASSNQDNNAKKQPNTHLSETVEGCDTTDADCDTMAEKADQFPSVKAEEFPSDKDIFKKSGYYMENNHVITQGTVTGDDHVRQVMNNAQYEIVQVEDKTPSNDSSCEVNTNLSAKPNSLHSNHAGTKFIERRTPTSFLCSNSTASAGTTSQKTSQNGPVFSLSNTKKAIIHPMVYLKQSYQNGAPLFFMADKSDVNEFTISAEEEHCNDKTDIRTMPSTSHSESSGSDRLDNVLGRNDDIVLKTTGCDSESATSLTNPNSFSANSSVYFNLDDDVYSTNDIDETQTIADESSIDDYEQLNAAASDHPYIHIDSKRYGNFSMSEFGRVCLEHSYSELSEVSSINSLYAKAVAFISKSRTAEDRVNGQPEEMDQSHVAEEMDYSVFEESLTIEDELDTSVDDLHSHLKGYKVRSRVCNIQELVDNRKAEDDLLMELKLKGKSHCLYIDRSTEGNTKLSVSCGYCSKTFTSLPDFLRHFDARCSFKSSDDLDFLLIDRSDPQQTIKSIPGIYLLPQCRTCQKKILEGKSSENFAQDRLNILSNMTNHEQFICKCKAKIDKPVFFLHGNKDKSLLSKPVFVKQNSFGDTDPMHLNGNKAGKPVKRNRASFGQPGDTGAMHIIRVNRGHQLYTCGICNTIFHSVPLFTNHISFGSCEDKVKNVPFFLNSGSSKIIYWDVELSNTKEMMRKNTGYMCRHCIRTFDSYGACSKHGEQCDFIGKHIPNVEFAMLERCNSCTGKQIRIADNTVALRELAHQFEIIYARLNKKFEVCDKSNIKCQCNQLRKKYPQIKTITFESDTSNVVSEVESVATTGNLETQTDKTLYSENAKKETVEIKETATEDVIQETAQINEEPIKSELDYETGILSKVETVVVCVPGAPVQKFERKIQIGATCSEEKCCCAHRFAYHTLSRKQPGDKYVKCGFCDAKLLDPSAFLKHVSKCSVSNEGIILPVLCRGYMIPYFCGLCSSTFSKLCEAVSHMEVCAKTFPYIFKDSIFGSMNLKLLPYCKKHYKNARSPGLNITDRGFEQYLDILIKLDPKAYCNCNPSKASRKKQTKNTVQATLSKETAPKETANDVKRKLEMESKSNLTTSDVDAGINDSQQNYENACTGSQQITENINSQEIGQKTVGSESRETKEARGRRREKLLKCTICGAKFSSRVMLRAHRDIHSNQSRICYICGKTVNSRQSMGMHFRVVHGINSHGEDVPPRKRFNKNRPRSGQSQCHLCGKIFKMKECLNYHFKFACKSKKTVKCHCSNC